MKKYNLRKERGITLIALIITIIILVILAAVSIRAVYNMGIVGHAINGTQDYAKGAKAENAMFGDLGNFLDKTLEKLRKVQGEVLEESDELQLADGELGLAYKVQEQENSDGTKSTYVVITPQIGGIETYESYARKILKTTTKTREQIFMEGDIYNYPEDEGSSLAQIIGYFGFEDATTLDELVESFNNREKTNYTIDDILIEWRLVEPAGYTASDEQVHVECTETGENSDINLGDNYGFYIEENGTYTFTGETQSNKTASVEVTINSIKYIRLSKSNISVYPDETTDLSATTYGVEGELKWLNSNPSVATLQNGIIKGFSVGTTVIQATNSDESIVSNECVVMVNELPAVDMYFGTSKISSLDLDGAIMLSAGASTTVNTPASNKNYTWTSSDTDIATVNNEGIVMCGTKNGTATITCSISGKKPAQVSVNSTSKIVNTGGQTMTISGTLQGTKSYENPTIPAGFYAIDTADAKWTYDSTNNKMIGVDSGLVIMDQKGNQFVWIPVEKAVEESEEMENTNNKKAMAVAYTEGTQTYYRGLLYNFKKENTMVVSSARQNGFTMFGKGPREPEILNGFDDNVRKPSGSAQTYLQRIGLNQSTFSSEIKSEYKNMIESVSEYGGFWIARYESSFIDNQTRIVAGVSPMNASQETSKYWYGLYDRQKKYATNNGLTSSVSSFMIWGSQYDAMLNWMINNNIDIITYESSKRNTSGLTGTKDLDKLNNIFDLRGNSYEWTVEADGAGTLTYDSDGDFYDSFRTVRGKAGSYGASDTPSQRMKAMPNGSLSNTTSRVTLYIK